MLHQALGYLQCGFGREIYIASSSQPEGPFEYPVKIYEVSDKYQGEFVRTYNAEAHHFNEQNELVATYSVNKTCEANSCNNIFNKFDADQYRIKAINVPYALFSK